MVKCCVPDCPHRSEITKHLHYYGFPKNKELTKKWVEAIGRLDKADQNQLWQPSPHSRICSWHFPNGKSAGPCRFTHNSEKVVRLKSLQKEPTSDTVTKESPNCADKATKLQDEILVSTLSTNSVIDSTTVKEAPAVSAQLEAELYFLNQEISELKEQLHKAKTEFSYHQIKNNDELVMLFTGLPSADLFDTIVSVCRRFKVNYKKGWKVEKLSVEDQIFMTLFILRSNLPFSDVAFRFSCSDTTVHNIFITWLHALHEIFFKSFSGSIPSMNKAMDNISDCFTTSAVYRLAMDTVDVYVQKTSSMNNYRLKTYNNCESRRGFKAVIGVAPNGVIVYVSDVYGGITFDKLLISECGILQLLQSDDLMVIEGKEYQIKDENQTETSKEQPIKYVTRHLVSKEVQVIKIAERAKLHLEKAGNRIKNYAILSCVPHSLRFFTTKIFQVCCVMANFHNPLCEVQQSSS